MAGADTGRTPFIRLFANVTGCGAIYAVMSRPTLFSPSPAPAVQLRISSPDSGWPSAAWACHSRCRSWCTWRWRLCRACRRPGNNTDSYVIHLRCSLHGAIIHTHKRKRLLDVGNSSVIQTHTANASLMRITAPLSSSPFSDASWAVNTRPFRIFTTPFVD